MASGSGGNRAGAHSLSVIVRAGHVIAADGTDQLAAPRFQTLRADWAIPGSVLVAGDRSAINVRDREAITVLLDHRAISVLRNRSSIGLRRSGLSSSSHRLRCGRNKPFLCGTFHGGDGYSTSSGKGKARLWLRLGQARDAGAWDRADHLREDLAAAEYGDFRACTLTGATLETNNEKGAS